MLARNRALGKQAINIHTAYGIMEGMDQNYEVRYKRWLHRQTKRATPSIIVLTFLSLIGIGISLLSPWPIKFLADSVFGEVPPPQILAQYSQMDLLFVVMGALIGLSLFQTVFDWVSSYIDTVLETNFNNRIQEIYFRHVLYLPLNSSSRLDDKDYIFRLNSESDSISNLALGSIVDIVSSLVNVIGILVVLFVIDWEMTAISLLTIPLLLLSVKFFDKRIQQQSIAEEQVSTSVFQHVSESIIHSDVVQSYNRQQGQSSKFSELLRMLKKVDLKGLFLSNEFGLVSSLVIGMAGMAIFLVGGHKVFAGELTFGVLLVFITYVSQVFGPLGELTDSLAERSSSHGQAKRFFEVIDDHKDIEEMDTGQKLSHVHGQIDFKNISFSYKNKPVLKDVNLHIKPGEKVAFIGPSGSGKSTLLSLLPRFGIQDKGFIYIDGHETSQVSLNSLRDQISIVSQEPKLFSITIGENIAFAKPDTQYPLPEIMSAAANAFATEFVDNLPNRYDTVIDSEGANLSGGQKQRIAIARAMFKRAPILLLDEPTSAQDTASEQKVLEGIMRLMEGKTVLMVTHKHSLLSIVDTVYVLENGEVRNVKDYGGLESYERYLQVHELNNGSVEKKDDQDPSTERKQDTKQDQAPKVQGLQMPGKIGLLK